MNIRIEVNCYGDKNVLQDFGLVLDIYAKTESQGKEIAKKFIDMIPEKKVVN